MICGCIFLIIALPVDQSTFFCGHCKLKTSKWQNLVHHLSTFDCYTARPCRAKFAFHELPPPVFPLSENPPGHTFSAEPSLVAKKFASSTITPVDIHESSLPYSSWGSADVPLSVGALELGPHLTMWPQPRPTSVPSGILIHPAVWPQQTWAESLGTVPIFGGAAVPI